MVILVHAYRFLAHSEAHSAAPQKYARRPPAEKCDFKTNEPNEHLSSTCFPISLAREHRARSDLDATTKRGHGIQDVSQYCTFSGPWLMETWGRRGRRGAEGFEPLSPQNSAGNRILMASNDNLAPVVLETRERIEHARAREDHGEGERERERSDRISSERER